jgi:Rad3-related DNA helicase
MSPPVEINDVDCFACYRSITPYDYQTSAIYEIIKALKKGQDVALTLPTGTGKTHIYLPIAMAAADSGYRVCVAVGTNLLIDQLMEKYVTQFNYQIQPHVVKGIEHYICMLTGDMADYSRCTKEQREECTKKEISCDVLTTMREMGEYPFILTNFHKFLSASSENSFDLVILDDSHSFENAVSDKFQVRIPYYQIDKIYKKYNGNNDIISDFVGNFLDLFDEAFTIIPNGKLHQRLSNETIMQISKLENYDELNKILIEIDDVERNILRDLLWFVDCCKNSTINTFYIQKDYYQQNDPSEAALIARKTDTFQERILNSIFKEAKVILASATPGNIKVHANKCTNRKYNKEEITVIPTTFPEIIENWFSGLTILETSDLLNDGVDAMRSKAEIASILLGNIPGKALLLFKSYRDQRLAEGILKARVMRKITFIDEGLDNEEVQKLVEDAEIIMASASSRLWEGIDIRQLKFEIIFSLPFIRPPVHIAEDRSFPFVVRKMLIRLQQGIGRLIRKADDKGICVVLDNRLSRYKNNTDFNILIKERIKVVSYVDILKEAEDALGVE